MASHLLYADQRSEVSAEFIDQLRTGDMLCTLVVDEVDDVEHEHLADRFAGMPGGVRLVTIGIDTTGSGTAGTLEVNPLDNELIQGILRDVARGIPDETARTLADYCEGSPKLAFILASRISENPELANAHEYLKDRSFRHKLEEYLRIDDDVAWRGVSAASILHRVGWTGDVERQSTTLFTALGLNAVDARRAVKDLDERLGVAPLAGRYRYVSPKILADYLAAREVEAWTRDDFLRVLGQFTPAMMQSFMRRMRHVGSVVENQEIIQDLIFGENGPFRSLADVEGTGLSFLFRHLSAVFPMAALRALERTIGEADSEELRTATESRRDVVWALEELLWPAETFEGAAWLVLQLAAAENEHWGNNATGLWSATFQMVLGRTEAGRAARVRTLRRAANHELPAFRVLACKAIESALNVEHESRLGNPPADVPGMPKESWRPETYGEWADTACDYLEIVRPLLDDPDGDVRKAAAECVGSGVEAGLALPSRLLDVWSDVALSLRDREYALRSPVLEAIDFHLARDEFIEENPEAEEEQLERNRSATIRNERLARLLVVREEIEGQDFQTRFRRTVSRDIWRTRQYEEAARERRTELEALADEAIQDPALLTEEWPWLFSRQTTTPEEWAEVLGTRDAGRVYADTIARLAREYSRGMGWLSLYEMGFAANHGNDSHIDDRIASLRADGASSEQIFDLLIRSNYTEDRLAIMVELFNTGGLGGANIGRVSFSTWRNTLSGAQIVDLGRAAARDPDASGACVEFLSRMLHLRKELRDDLEAVSLELLDRPIRLRGGSGIRSYEWTELAKHYLDKAPVAIGRSAARLIAANQTAHERFINRTVRAAWERADKTEFFKEVLAPWLDERTIEGWWVRQALEHFPLTELPVDILESWVAESPETRARALAEMLSEPLGARPSNLHAMLLERFDEYGVGNAFYGKFISGVFTGSSAARTKGLIEEAQGWIKDERPAVREWARGVVRSLEEMLERDQIREDEERFM